MSEPKEMLDAYFNNHLSFPATKHFLIHRKGIPISDLIFLFFIFKVYPTRTEINHQPVYGWFPVFLSVHTAIPAAPFSHPPGGRSPL